MSELCERNATVAMELGKNDVSVSWKIIKIMYAEEFAPSSMNLNSNKLEDGACSAENTDDQKSKGIFIEFLIRKYLTNVAYVGGETPAAQFSGGDEETENEDQVDNAFPNYLNVRNGCLPKGDFFFGENELDVELEGAPVFLDYYQYGFRLNPVTPEQIGELCSVFINQARIFQCNFWV